MTDRKDAHTPDPSSRLWYVEGDQAAEIPAGERPRITNDDSIIAGGQVGIGAPTEADEDAAATTVMPAASEDAPMVVSTPTEPAPTSEDDDLETTKVRRRSFLHPEQDDDQPAPAQAATVPAADADTDVLDVPATEDDDAEDATVPAADADAVPEDAPAEDDDADVPAANDTDAPAAETSPEEDAPEAPSEDAAEDSTPKPPPTCPNPRPRRRPNPTGLRSLPRPPPPRRHARRPAGSRWTTRSSRAPRRSRRSRRASRRTCGRCCSRSSCCRSPGSARPTASRGCSRAAAPSTSRQPRRTGVASVRSPLARWPCSSSCLSRDGRRWARSCGASSRSSAASAG